MGLRDTMTEGPKDLVSPCYDAQASGGMVFSFLQLQKKAVVDIGLCRRYEVSDLDFIAKPACVNWKPKIAVGRVAYEEKSDQHPRSPKDRKLRWSTC